MTGRPRRRGRLSKWVSVALATPVHLLTLAMVAFGVWLLWPGSNWVLKVLGVLCLSMAWVLRPVLGRSRSGDGLVERYVDAAILTLRRWEELMAPYRPDFKINPEHQLLLVASGRKDTIAHHAEAGVLGDLVTLLLQPFRMLATVYRRLLERTLPCPAEDRA